MSFWSKLCAVVMTVATACALGAEANFGLDPSCAATLLAGPFAAEYSRTRIYAEPDKSYLITISSPRHAWEIPIRRYSPAANGGYDVTYYFDPVPGPAHVARLPKFRSVEIRPVPEQTISIEWEDDESDVSLSWEEWVKIFGLDPSTIDTYVEAAADRLLATDHMNPNDLGHFIAIAQSPAAVDILKRGIPALRSHQNGELCNEAKEHLFATKPYSLTRDLDDPDETNFLMLRKSLFEMRENRFEDEADLRARALLRAIACPE